MTTPTEPPVRPAALRPLRAWTDFDRLAKGRTDDPKIIGSAALLTILLHLSLFFWVLPWLGTALQMSRNASTASVTAAPPPIEYVLTPLTPADQQALKYIETNPNAPVAKPIETNNISSRDQRVAQPNPNPNGNSDKPRTDGDQLNSPKILEGTLSKPVPAPATPPTPNTQQSPQPTQASAPTAPVIAAQPTAFPAKPTSTDGDGIRFDEKPPEKPSDKPADSTQPPTTADAEPSPRLRPGPLTPDVVAESAATATPESRQSLAVKTHAGPMLKETQGTHNAATNLASVDAKFTPFGAYQEMMYEAIASEWDNECAKFSFNLRDAGTAVEIQFSINSQGEIADLQVLNSTATRGATLMCVNAIKVPAPYSAWSKEMVAVLGNSTEFRITFYYR